jgi:alpha-glucosidase
MVVSDHLIGPGHAHRPADPQAADGAWLVEAATDESPRELDIPLAFLGLGRYRAIILQDGNDSDYRTHRESYKTEQRLVTSADTIHVKLAPGGGACVLLNPSH